MQGLIPVFSSIPALDSNIISSKMSHYERLRHSQNILVKCEWELPSTQTFESCSWQLCTGRPLLPQLHLPWFSDMSTVAFPSNGAVSCHFTSFFKMSSRLGPHSPKVRDQIKLIKECPKSPYPKESAPASSSHWLLPGILSQLVSPNEKLKIRRRGCMLFESQGHSIPAETCRCFSGRSQPWFTG